LSAAKWIIEYALAGTLSACGGFVVGYLSFRDKCRRSDIAMRAGGAFVAIMSLSVAILGRY
jgi:hypothetical protein